jgi:hypothetical protein
MFSRRRGLVYPIRCTLPFKPSNRLVWNNDILKLVLRNHFDSVGICLQSDIRHQLSHIRGVQIPITNEQMAKPVMVFLTRYGARARSRAGWARIRAS